jgi:hypothetical protein
MRLPDLRQSKRDYNSVAEATAAAIASLPPGLPGPSVESEVSTEIPAATTEAREASAADAPLPAPTLTAKTAPPPAVEVPEAIEQGSPADSGPSADVPSPPAIEAVAEPAVPPDQAEPEAVAVSSAVEPPADPAVVAEIEPVSSGTIASESPPSDPVEVSPAVAAESEAASAEPAADASPASAPEPISPAAARRQRALERQRRQLEQSEQREPTPSWWRTHVPRIAAGFLIALSLTIYAGLKNRGRQAAAVPDPEVPTLDIAEGSPSESPVVEPGRLADSSDAPAVIAQDKPTGKSPLLLSAKPSINPAADRLISAPETAPETIEAEEETMPSESVPSATPASSSDIKNPYVEAGGLNAPANVPGHDDSAAAPAVEYPSTEPAVYRPGGRVPKTSRVPNYPRTSTPYLR